MTRRATRPDLDAVVAAIDARCDRWQALLPLRDLLKSQPDATWAPGELEDAGYDHALRVLDRERPLRSRRVGGRR